MTSLFSLNNKNVLITGASRGLGQSMAIGLARAGARVVCSSTLLGGCRDTIRQIHSEGGVAIEVAADLGNRKEVEMLYGQAVRAVERIDVLVNNGGTIFRKPASDYPLTAWDKILEVNLTSSFLLARLVYQGMVESGSGKIINVASVLSYSGGITVPAYTASKHAIAGITKALANEWAKDNIQVNAIAPGYFQTDMTGAIQSDEARAAAIKKRIPSGRWGQPSDLQGVVIFLASGASDYVNGTIITVDGGWLAN